MCQSLTIASAYVADLRTKIAYALSKSLLLKFTIEQNEEPFAGGFMIRAKLPMIEGYRRCHIVGGQTSDGEIFTMFKVMEYGWPPDLALGALLSRPSETTKPFRSAKSICPLQSKNHDKRWG